MQYTKARPVSACQNQADAREPHASEPDPGPAIVRQHQLGTATPIGTSETSVTTFPSTTFVSKTTSRSFAMGPVYSQAVNFRKCSARECKRRMGRKCGKNYCDGGPFTEEEYVILEVQSS